MKAWPSVRSKTKPIVLLVLAGEFHLDLYASVLERLRDFTWAVYIRDVVKVPQETLERLGAQFGVRFFLDKATALAHFGDIDAVVTTFAVPHAAHLHYLDFISLAYEMEIPVFELQHGLLQLGFSFSEDATLIGSGDKGRLARNGLPVRNLVADQLRWFGEDAIGYPPFTEAAHPDIGYLPDEPAPEPDRDTILYLTNFHWNLLTREESRRGYNMIISAILALPDCTHVISPHPSEMGSPAYREMIETLSQRGVENYTIERPADAAGRLAMLRRTKLAVSSISTVLLDLEMAHIPTVVFGFESFASLLDGFETCASVSTREELVAAIKEAMYGSYAPEFRSGRLQPFDAGRLSAAIRAKLPAAAPEHRHFVPLIHKYLGKV